MSSKKTGSPSEMFEVTIRHQALPFCNLICVVPVFLLNLNLRLLEAIQHSGIMAL